MIITTNNNTIPRYKLDGSLGECGSIPYAINDNTAPMVNNIDNKFANVHFKNLNHSGSRFGGVNSL